MKLYDTRTGRLAEFVAGRTVRVYACGITPYDAAHVGHAFTYTVFDALVRYLQHEGHRVRYARNITDLDDDILGKARELGVPFDELARREVDRFDHELLQLGLRPPDVVPWATETVPAIVASVRGLLRRGCAYALEDGRVYFDVRAATGLGALSRLDRAAMLEQFAEKGGDPEAPGKRDSLDFLLWQPSGPGEPSWPTDWGQGRPGWHIECSVMAMEHLGNVIDIHGGGSDLIFPHHEAEILQSEHLTGQRPFARFWVHTGMVGLDSGKMSKSRGNLVFLSDLLERFEPQAVRRYLLEHHYRSDWEFADGALEDAATACKRWREGADGDRRAPALARAFHEAMSNDLDTPSAMALLDEAAAAGAGRTLRGLAGVLGFDLDV
ncbi:MAG TPA: cysteine--tRNA ligase [Egibacteraceae bacterium]|nr:cysteine--tRNA ligase [Actinomycetota bacterium]HWB72790.1 cysteine--tRNA ligase [Egibacteraceae bacterium]